MGDDNNYLLKYKEELISVLHKSQDTFEKQLSYISAGSLALSMAFIKDMVKDISGSHCKTLLILGWISLAVSLLVNCISHIRASELHNRTINEINCENYNDKKVSKRLREIRRTNWISVGAMVLGIIFIIIFVSINL